MISSLFENLCLFAQVNRWRSMGSRFRGSRGRGDISDLLPYLIGMVVIGIGVAIVVAIAKRKDFSKPCDDPNKLFRQLCIAHHLDFGSRRLLLKLATALDLAQPALVFVTPEAFEPNHLPPQLYAEQARLAELSQRLF